MPHITSLGICLKKTAPC